MSRVKLNKLESKRYLKDVQLHNYLKSFLKELGITIS